MPRRALFTIAAVVLGVLAWAEIVHARSSRRGFDDVPASAEAPRRQAVVVLGYRNPQERANAVNRYRVRAGLRSLDPAAAESVLVLCGGAVGGDVPEAELLARHARLLGYTGPIRLDAESRTTEENIRNAIPLIEDADAITIVSNSLHAEKARAYLRRLRPDLARRLRPGAEHRIGEVVWMKPFAAVLGLRELAGPSRGLPSRWRPCHAQCRVVSASDMTRGSPSVRDIA